MVKTARILILVLIAPVVLYYLWTRAFVYLNYRREVYTDYFWYRAPWLLGHVVLGISTFLIGTLQLIPALRKGYPALHRGLGKIYIVCVVVSTGISFYLDATSKGSITYRTGLFTLAIAWLLTTLMGYACARFGNFDMHREWMIKSFVLTLSFVTFRFVDDLLARAGIGDFWERKVLVTWACWVIPLFVTELVLQVRRLYKFKTRLLEKG
jgi:uncharacterized membrane protein